MSASSSSTDAIKQSSGPVAFGSVNIAPASSSSSLWPMLAAAALIVFYFFKRKAS